MNKGLITGVVVVLVIILGISAYYLYSVNSANKTLGTTITSSIASTSVITSIATSIYSTSLATTTSTTAASTSILVCQGIQTSTGCLPKPANMNQIFANSTVTATYKLNQSFNSSSQSYNLTANAIVGNSLGYLEWTLHSISPHNITLYYANSKGTVNTTLALGGKFNITGYYIIVDPEVYTQQACVVGILNATTYYLSSTNVTLGTATFMVVRNYSYEVNCPS